MDADQPLTTEKVEAPVEEKAIPEAIQTDTTEPMPDFASNYLPLVDYYGISSMNQEDQSKLQLVWEHFAREEKDPGTVLKKIRMEHMNMHKPNLGDSMLNQMFNYVRILQDIKTAEDMKEAYRK